MMPKKPLIGQRFGMLTVIEDVWPKTSKHLCVCRCDCGKIVTRSYCSLTKDVKTVRSCGCNNVKRKPLNVTMFNAYRGLVARHPEVRNYWPNRITFAKAAINFDGYNPSEKQSLTRKDASKGYEPNNMRWKSQSENYPRIRSYYWLSYWHPEIKLYWPNYDVFWEQAKNLTGFDPKAKQRLDRIEYGHGFYPKNLRWVTLNERSS